MRPNRGGEYSKKKKKRGHDTFRWYSGGMVRDLMLSGAPKADTSTLLEADVWARSGRPHRPVRMSGSVADVRAEICGPAHLRCEIPVHGR